LRAPGDTSDPIEHRASAQSLADRLVRVSLQHPWVLMAIALALTVAALWRAQNLKLRPELEQLLPSDQPSVVALDDLRARLPAQSNVFVVLEAPSAPHPDEAAGLASNPAPSNSTGDNSTGDNSTGETTGQGVSADTERLRAMADELAAHLETSLGPPFVARAESGVHEALHFLQPRAGLYASQQKLETLREDLEARKRAAYARRFGADLGLGDWEDEDSNGAGDQDNKGTDHKEDATESDSLKELLGAQGELIGDFPSGYYQSKDGRALVVVVRSEVAADNLPVSTKAVAAIQRETATIQARYPTVRVSFAGDLVTGLTEYSAIRTDLLSVGALGVAMVLSVILLFYLRLRPLFLLALTIVIGCSWTFGLTEIFIGVLNTASGFMFSIVAGNGINFGIIFQSRYLEERDRGLNVHEALRTCVRATWRPTLSAAVAAAAAYGAMGATDFRGFRDFAFIGGTGMVLCWIATYSFLPALLALSERISPLRPAGRTTTWLDRARDHISRFEAPFALVVNRNPKRVALIGTGLVFAGLALTALYIKRDPIEYNMRKLENDKTTTAEVYRASALALQIIGSRNESAMVLLADSVEQVDDLQAALRARRDAAPKGDKPFHDAHTLNDFVPADQASKLDLLRGIRKLLLKAHDLDGISQDEWENIKDYVPPADLKPFTVADLPEAVTRWFSEKDGTVGRVIYISPAKGRSDTDLRYLQAFAAAYRQIQLPSGETVVGSGRAVVYADLVTAVIEDMPRAIGFSLLAVILVVLIGFRSAADSSSVLSALLVGLALLGGMMALFDIKLHFINFAALPITLGIGADYALNMLHRYREGGRGQAGVQSALKGVTGPVVLCSLTTTLAYLALVSSSNQAVRSLGLIAVLGELTCLVGAAAFMPALLLWSAQRKPAS